MPCLPRNLHLVTWRSPDNAIRKKNTQRNTSKVLRLPRKMTLDTSKVQRLPRKLQLILRKRRKSIAPATQNDFRHLTKHVCHAVTRLPRETKQRDIWSLQKWLLLQNLPKAQPYGDRANGCGRLGLRTAADGCGRRANTPSTPNNPRVKREPLLRIRANGTLKSSASVSDCDFWSKLPQERT